MKNYIYIAVILSMLGCTREVDTQYDNVGRIYFQYEKANSLGNMARIDSVTFSFGKLPDEIQDDTARIVVCLMGIPATSDRTYRVKVVETGEFVKGKTTLVVNKNYDPIATEQTFHKNNYTDTLRVALHRSDLSTSLKRPESRTLILRLESSDDFKPGTIDGYEMKLSVNNFLPAPKWWEANSSMLGFYHPKKWKLIISMDERFAVEDVLTAQPADVYIKAGILRSYLGQNIVIDEETGYRVTMDGLVPLS